MYDKRTVSLVQYVIPTCVRERRTHPIIDGRERVKKRFRRKTMADDEKRKMHTDDEANRTPLPPNPQPEHREGPTVKEIVQATVRGMMLYEHTRQSPRPVTPQQQTVQPTFSNKGISALLSDFSGENEDAELWLQRVDAVQLTYNVPDEVIQLLAIGKLTGKARAWHLSKVELIRSDWRVVKRELRKMFFMQQDTIQLRRTFERRRWQRTEKFTECFHHKVSLGDRAMVNDSDLIHYVIDGFDDKTLQSQAGMILPQIKSIEDLCTMMSNVTRDPGERVEKARPERTQAPGTAIHQGNPLKFYNVMAPVTQSTDAQNRRERKVPVSIAVRWGI